MEKILEVSCNGLVNGGVQHVIMNIVSALHADYQFDVLVFTEGPDYFDADFLTFGGKIFRMPNKQYRFKKNIDFYTRGPRIFFGTLKLLRENGPYTAIHCHNFFESAFCLMAAKVSGVKIRIAHSHNDLIGIPVSVTRRIKERLLRPVINRNATLRVGCSQGACKYLFGGNVPAKTIHNGIDLAPFAPGKQTPDYIAGDTIRLLHVGNFGVQKNQLFLVDILAVLKKRGVPFRMTMVGGGDEAYRERVAEKIRQEGLEPFVVLLPSNSDVPAEMRRADLFLLPSMFEGLGIVLIEAQASGLHSLVSKRVPPEADLGNLTYMEALDAENWADEIEKIASQGMPRKSVDMSEYDLRSVAQEYRLMFRMPDQN